MDNLIAKLHQSPKTVLTNKDLALLWEENNQDNLYAKTSYYVKQGALKRLTRGVYAKGKEYNSKELATSLYSPSYVSFETVLREAGVIFQHYDTIFAAGPTTKTVTVDNNIITFRKLKDTILFNGTGIHNDSSCSIASVERAFLDMIYLFPDYYFDNLQPINFEKCIDLAPIYGNQQLVKRLKKYQKNHAQ